MLRPHLSDHRRSSEAALLEGLRSKDPLALAEAYHRSAPAAYACARRLLGSSSETEALLRAVYSELWERPLDEGPLEGWLRSRCFALGVQHLRELGRGPASPSTHELLDDLPAPESRHDPVEEILAGLDPEERRVLVEAHDRGLSTAEADDPRNAATALERALLTLGGPDAQDAPDASACGGLPLGDWVLGLLSVEAAQRVEQETSAREACATRARLLRRGRRRLEGLPPTPDMGQRILVSILAGAPQAPTAAATAVPEAADDDLDLPDDELASALDLTETADPDEGAELPSVPSIEVEDDWSERDAAEWGPEETAGTTAQPEDDTWLWEDEESEDAKPRRGRRLLGFLGVLLLVAIGALVGMFLGSLVVGS